MAGSKSVYPSLTNLSEVLSPDQAERLLTRFRERLETLLPWSEV
ncbi:MAG: hypothetical protein CEO22_527, partial [Candidatus Berkelbacteria bacterium Gr01-1014_85]